jgi:hypothetical protein
MKLNEHPTVRHFHEIHGERPGPEGFAQAADGLRQVLSELIAMRAAKVDPERRDAQ